MINRKTLATASAFLGIVPIYIVSPQKGLLAVLFIFFSYLFRDKMWLKIALFICAALVPINGLGDPVFFLIYFIMPIKPYVLFFDERRKITKLLALSTLELLASSTKVEGPIFFIPVLLFVILSPLILLCEQRLSYQKQIEIDKSFALTFFLSSFLMVFATSLFFVTIPRFALGIRYLSKKAIRATLTKNIGLSDLTEFKSKGKVVMRVKIEPKISGFLDLHFKLFSLARYKNGRWVDFPKKRVKVKKVLSGTFLIRKGRPKIKEVFYLEIPTMYLPYALFPCLLSSYQINDLYKEGDDEISTPNPFLKTISYTIYASLKENDVPKLSKTERLFYLDTESFPKSIKKLAKKICSIKENPKKKAFLVERYLNRNYMYKEDVKKVDLQRFLFSYKKGQCEHFATAAVALLRFLGVPARFCVGYTSGTYNPFGEYYLIKEKDSHAWAEAYVEDEGWITIDPTPREKVVSNSYKIFAFLDYLKRIWEVYVMEYDKKTQKGFFRKVKKFGERLSLNYPKRWFGEGKRALTTLLFLISILLSIFLFLKEKEKNFYMIILSLFEKRGIHKEPFETPHEFAKRMEEKFGKLKPLHDLTKIYYKLEFSREKPSIKEDEIKKKIEELDKLLSKLFPNNFINSKFANRFPLWKGSFRIKTSLFEKDI